MEHCRRIVAHLAVLVLAGGLYFIQGPQFVRYPNDRLADGGDSILNAWILAWNAHALFDPHLRVWDAPIFYPARNTFTFSETMFGNLWITLPLQYWTGNPVLAFNALVFFAFVLGMYFTFLLVRQWTGSYLAGVASGFLFSFNPLRWAEVCHVQLLPFFWAPIALLFCHHFLETRRIKWFLCLGIVLVVQFYTSIYLGIILFLTLLVFSAVHVIGEMSGPERRMRLKNYRLWGRLIACSTLCFLALIPLGIPYLQSVQDWNFVRSESENASFSCELISFIVPDACFKNYQWWQQIFQGRIRGFYGLGLVPATLAVTGWILMRRTRGFYASGQVRVFRRITWTALAMVVFMLGPYLIVGNYKTDIPLPYLLVYYGVPGAKAMRVPARFVFPLLLCLAIMAGFAVAYLVSVLKRRPPAWQLIWSSLGLLLLALDYSVADNPGISLPVKDRFPPVYEYLAQSNSGQPVLELPVHWQQQFRYLHFQTGHWRPLVGGESGSYPPAILEMTKRLQGPPTEATLRFLSLVPAKTVVVHLDLYDAATAEAWGKADLRSNGFQCQGQMGKALVWERQGPPEPSSPTLRVARPVMEYSQSFFRDAWKIDAVVTSADPHLPWRSLERGISDVEIAVTDCEGKEYRFTKTVEMLPYLLPGESASLKIGKIQGPSEKIKRIRIRGSLIQEFDGVLAGSIGLAEH